MLKILLFFFGDYINTTGGAETATLPEHLSSPPVFSGGPLLFLVYVNDIGEKLRLFADDTSLGYSITSSDAFELVINNGLV